MQPQKMQKIKNRNGSKKNCAKVLQQSWQNFSKFTVALLLGQLLCLCLSATASLNKKTVPLSPRTISSTHNQINLPEMITFKNHQFTITRDAFYALHEGLIYIRDRNKDGQAASPWRIFEGNGVPSSDHKKFIPPHRIIQIEADGDLLVALDENLKIYKWDLVTFTLKHTWQDIWGEPTSEALYLPSNARAWSIGRQNWETLYHQDTDGNKFYFGKTGIMTLYSLDQNGQEIYYADTGLPGDFSRQICTPKRGRFVAENLSASGATVFLISKTGEMYTRMEDYDINGGAPLYSYHYDPRPKQKKYDGISENSNIGHRKLPLEDWQLQPQIPLGANGQITRNISILSTADGDDITAALKKGKKPAPEWEAGNFARELRVQGYAPELNNGQRQSGYYYKKIDAPLWQFKTTGELILESDIIPYHPENAQTAPNWDMSFSGILQIGSEKSQNLTRYPVEFKNFNIFCSPNSLDIYFDNSKTKFISLNFHFVDAWTPFSQKDALHDPMSMQKYKVTLEIPPEYAQNNDPEIQELLNRIKPYHWKSFEIAAIANTHVIEMRSKPQTKKTAALSLTLFRSRPNPEGNGQIYDDQQIHFYQPIALSPQYELDSSKMDSREDLLNALHSNVQLIKDFNKSRYMIRHQKEVFELIGNNIKLAEFLTHLVGTVTLTKFFVPKLKLADYIFEQAWTVKTANILAAKHLLEYSKSDFEAAMQIVLTRICKLYRQLEHLTGPEVEKSSRLEQIFEDRNTKTTKYLGEREKEQITKCVNEK